MPSSPADAFLPLPVAEFHILVSLAADARHGYALMAEVERRTAGRVILGPGTLYTALRRMTERGLVAAAAPPGADRRLVYRITTLGRDVVVAEGHRMAECLAMVRATSLAPRLSTGTP